MNLLIISNNENEQKIINIVKKHLGSAVSNKYFIIVTNNYKNSLKIFNSFTNFDIIAIDVSVISNDSCVLSNIRNINSTDNKYKMNKYRILIFSIALVLCMSSMNMAKLYAQPFNNSYSLSFANISTVTNSQWNAQTNPASAAVNNNVFLGASYANLYKIESLNYIVALLTIPVKNNNFGLGVNAYGIPEYRESTFTVSYGKHLTPKFNFGLAFNYHLLKILGLSNKNSVSINIAAQYLLTKNIQLGVLLQNITGSKYGMQKVTEKYSSFNLGLAYSFNQEKVKLFSEIRKSLEHTMDVAIAISYDIMAWAGLSAGISTTPLNHYGGIRLKLKKMIVNLAFNMNRNLPGYPSISLDYAF
ncbi:MAG: hypothetical protein ACQPRJ_02120 [Solitalea-like symbiont of Acarus siro]